MSAVVAVLALVAGTVTTAAAQEQQAPTVEVQPVGTSSNDPNAGQWFVVSLDRGATARVDARVVNPAFVDQTVRLYLLDIRFGPDGNPQVTDSREEVGSWGGFERSEITVPARESVITSFTIKAPTDVEPGDHVGAVVAEHRPERGEAIGVVKRAATRLYVTIPGTAAGAFVIDDVQIDEEGWFLPREVSVTTTLRNTGRVRLRPSVTVNGESADGPQLLMSQSKEPYLVTLPVSFWGGLLRYRVDATTMIGEGAGPSRQMRVSTFIFPWHLLFLLALAVGLFFGGRWIWRKRGSKYDALQSDIRRLERLLSGVAAGQQGTEDSLPDGRDPETAIRAAIKQARRAGDEDTVRRLEAKLDEVRGTSPEDVLGGATADDANPAVAAILRDIADAPPKRQGALIQAARAYGIKELRKHQAAIDGLPDEVRVRLLARKSPAKPSSGTKGRPAKRKK